MNKTQEIKAREMSAYTTKALETLRELEPTTAVNYFRKIMHDQLSYYEELLFGEVEYFEREVAIKTRMAQIIVEGFGDTSCNL